MARAHAERPFEREAYFQLAVLLGPLLLGLLFTVVALVVFRLAEEVSIDRCLDRGGAWNYEEGGCKVPSRSRRADPSR